jgi:hypothetical protein
MKAPPVATPAGIVTTPPGWVQLDEGHFTLYVPGGAYFRKAQAAGGIAYGDIVGTNGCVRFKIAPQAALLVDKARHPEFDETAVMVDGRPGVLRRTILAANERHYWFPGCEASIYLGLLVPGALPGGAGLAVEAIVPSEEAADDMMMTFKSIRFTKRA